MAFTARDLAVEALQEIGSVGADGAASADDVNFALSKINRLLDGWNADGLAVYAEQFDTETLTAGLNPHTLGPTGATWTFTQRPESIESVMLIISGYRYVIDLHDAAWWAAEPAPLISTSIPTDGYYAPTWPNGALYLYPVPSTAYDVQIMRRVVLSQLALTDTFSLPPGYRDAITLTVAEDLCGPMRVDPPALLPMKAMKARARVFEANTVTPALQTRDYGVPGGTPSWFNWRTGTWQ